MTRNADQTYLKTKFLTMAWKISIITALIQWMSNKLLVIVNESVSFKRINIEIFFSIWISVILKLKLFNEMKDLSSSANLKISALAI